MLSCPLRASLACGLALVLSLPAWARPEPVDRLVPDAAALAGQPMTALPPPPDWMGGSAATVATIDQIKAQFAQITAKPPHIFYVRESFLQPDLTWLTKVTKWFRRLSKPLNLHYQDELFDCDKYSRCFVAFADLLAQKAGESRASLAVGWATVFNERSFAGVAAGGMHAVVVVVTASGVFVIEPQNGRMVALRDYPNRDRLAAVYL